jgi:citrate lyase subunit beta/citryl-CoA lyase
VLHPDQIGIANEVYSPTQAEFDRAEALLDAYRQAQTVERRGAILRDGVMIDEASRKMAESIAARGRATGLGRSGPDATS